MATRIYTCTNDECDAGAHCLLVISASSAELEEMNAPMSCPISDCAEEVEWCTKEAN